MTRTKLLTALCQLTLLPIRSSSRCTSKGIPAMPINSDHYKWTGHCPRHHFLQQGVLKCASRYSKALLPVLIDFFRKHPLIEPKAFLGDAAFDTIKIYKSLFEEIGFQKAFIPLKTTLSIEGIDYTVNENGIPCCSHDPTLPMSGKAVNPTCEANFPP